MSMFGGINPLSGGTPMQQPSFGPPMGNYMRRIGSPGQPLPGQPLPPGAPPQIQHVQFPGQGNGQLQPFGSPGGIQQQYSSLLSGVLRGPQQQRMG